MTDQSNLESTCPLCGNDNACAIAAGEPAESCWCFSQFLDKEILESLPEEARGKYCVCAGCGSATTRGDNDQGVKEV